VCVVGEEEDISMCHCQFYINTGSISFPRHERNPQVSTSKVNLVTEASVDFDYAKIPLIKTHG